MVSTKHCCWETCNSDSRYPEKLHNEIAEGNDKIRNENIHSLSKAVTRKAVNAGLMLVLVKISLLIRIPETHICAVHWPGERCPTDEFSNPLKANFTAHEVFKAYSLECKAPRLSKGFG